MVKHNFSPLILCFTILQIARAAEQHRCNSAVRRQGFFRNACAACDTNHQVLYRCQLAYQVLALRSILMHAIQVQGLPPMAPEPRSDDVAFHLALGLRGLSHSISRLRDYVTHLQPIDWTKVEDHWAEHPLTDLYGFESLLQDCSNRVLPFEALMGKFRGPTLARGRAAGSDLCMLAERSAEHDVNGIGLITHYIIDVFDLHRCLENLYDGTPPDVTHTYATWRVLLCLLAGELNETVPARTRSFADALRATTVAETPPDAGRMPALVLHTLLWGGTEGSSYNTLFAREETAKKAEQRLTRVLVRACDTCAIDACTGEAPALLHNHNERKGKGGLGVGHHIAARLFKDLFRSLLEPALASMPIATVVCLAVGMVQSVANVGNVAALRGAAHVVLQEHPTRMKDGDNADGEFFAMENWDMTNTLSCGRSLMSPVLVNRLYKAAKAVRDRAEVTTQYDAAVKCLERLRSETDPSA